jgi:cytochrome c556
MNPNRFSSKLGVALALAIGSVSINAYAQFNKPQDAIKYRQSSFFVMQQNFARLAAMAQGKTPFNAKEAAEYGQVASLMARQPWQAFGPGTEGGKSLPLIWNENAKFQTASKNFIQKMDALQAATQSGNLDRIKAAVSAAGADCKSCHDAFRD